MQTHIFAEGSNTTVEDRDQPLKKYYDGLFSQVAGLHDELAELTEAHLHILSEDYGVAKGEETISSIFTGEQMPVGSNGMADQAKTEFLDTAADADVMVILLSSNVFQQTVKEEWDELVEVAKPESIWCLGAARSSLEGLNFEELEAKGCTLLTYQRVGVARIGTDTREELLEDVKRKAAQ
jgi:methylmalonyl-CoA mutase cobalamin-binding subunit